jgi:hypothetical protein
MPALPPGVSEAAEIIKMMIGLGLPDGVMRPNQQFPLPCEPSISTVDEVGILVEARLISPDMYAQEAPLAIVAHRRHGARVVDILRKVGFSRPQILLLSPATPDSRGEVALRIAYRALVLGSSRRVAPEILRRRELRLVAAQRRLNQLIHHRTDDGLGYYSTGR